MVEIKKEDIDQYELIGSGAFGMVYKVDDHTAYKVYIPTLYDAFGHPFKNPALRMPKRKFRRLRERAKDLKYTDVLKDVLFMDGEYAGIVLPYYGGGSLVNALHLPFSLKLDYSKQLVRNGKELTDHYIYPMDYKLNNILLDDGKVRIIDLDDALTHVCATANPFYCGHCIDDLNETIQTIFCEHEIQPYSHAVKNSLFRNRGKFETTYEGIEEYLELKEEDSIPFLLCGDDSHLGTLRKVLHNHPFHVIYQPNQNYYDDNYYLKMIQMFHEKGIDLFDIISFYKEQDEYFKNFAASEHFELKGKQLLKRKD